MADLYFDHDVDERVMWPLLARGHSVVTARQIGLRSASDGAQMLQASLTERILVTCNGKDFRLLHDAWFRWSQAWQIAPRHFGILILRQPMQPDDAARALLLFLESDLPGMNELYIWRPLSGWERQSLRP